MVVIWLLTRAAGMVYIACYPDVAGDLSIYAAWAAKLQSGQLPYVDFNMEYPPGILPLLLIPASHVAAYRRTFLAVALVADALVQRFLTRTGRRLGAVVWLGAPSALGAVFWSRLDIFVAVAFIIAMQAVNRRRAGIVAVAVVWAASLKLWPFAMIPALWRSVPSDRRWRYGGYAVLCLLAAVVPTVTLGGAAGLRWMLNYHRGRGVGPESLPAVVMHVARLAGAGPHIIAGHGAAEFEPAVWPMFVHVDDLLLAVGLAGVVAYAAARRRPAALPQVLLLGVTVVLCLGKVLSPQYTVWAVAVVVMLVDDVQDRRDSRALMLATFGLLIATQYLWPIGLPELIDGSIPGLLVGAVHAVSLVAFSVVAVRCAASNTVAIPLPADGAAERRAC